jgi:bis(5'-nucleosyl)-tetraphosphatase (symmetrical)
MAVYAIGDLQGCLDPLQRLLDRIRFDPARDRLWFCGDLVNRGPASLAALRFVRQLGDRAVTVLGNHDLHLLATAWAGSRPRKKRDTLDEVLAAPDREELLEWLRRRPLLHHDPVLDCTLVHAGLPPQWDLADAQAAARELESVMRGDRVVDFLRQMYGDQPDRWTPELAGTERLRFIVNAFTRLRYLRSDGSMDFDCKETPDHAPPGLIPWFRFPGRRSAGLKLIFGHWSTLGELTHDGAHGLDTGCVWGGRLSALRLDDFERSCVECGPGLPAADSG